MDIVPGKIFKNGNSKAINYTKQDQQHFKLGLNEMLIKRYSKDGQSMTLLKMTKDEYEKHQYQDMMHHYTKTHQDVLDALEDL